MGPDAAETVATLLAGQATATVTSRPTGAQVAAEPALAPDGTPLLVVRGGDLTRLGLHVGEDDVAVRVDLTSCAPLPDLTLPRAHAVLAGWATPRPVSEIARWLGARAVTGDLAGLHRTWPDARLLALDPAEVTLHWAHGCTDVDPGDLATAEPDPLAPREGEALQRVQAEHGDGLLGLVRSTGSARPATGDRPLDVSVAVAVRAVGLDRWGVTLRCLLAPGRERSLRMPFPAPVRSVDEAVATLGLLLARHECCPVARARG
ncbi:DUF2470 domain-containing protein [Thalassiella azotivora]